MIKDPAGYRRALLHRLSDIEQIILAQSHCFYSADAKAHTAMADARDHLDGAKRELPKLRQRLRPYCSLDDLREVRAWTDRWLKAFGKFVSPHWAKGIKTPTVDKESRENVRKTLPDLNFPAGNVDLSFGGIDFAFLDPPNLDSLVLKSCKKSRIGRKKRCKTVLVGAGQPVIRNFNGHRKSLRRKLTQAERCIQMALDEADGLPAELRTWLIESRDKFIPEQRARLIDLTPAKVRSVRRGVAKWGKKFTDVLIALAAPKKPKLKPPATPAKESTCS